MIPELGNIGRKRKFRVDGKMVVSLIWYMLGLNYSVIYLMGLDISLVFLRVNSTIYFGVIIL